MFTALGEYYCVRKKSNRYMKPSVATDEAAYNL